MANFQPARAKLTIGSLDDASLTVKADYNPKELQLSKQLSWKDHNEVDSKDRRPGRNASQQPANNQKQDSVELTGEPKRTLTIEMLFDGFEINASVSGAIDVLERLSTSEVTVDGRDRNRKRPHYCVVVWGQQGIPPFRCVIDKLDVKYTMFDGDGLPLRAVCTVTLQEARIRTTGSVDAEQAKVYQRSYMKPTERAINYTEPGVGQPPRPMTDAEKAELE